jgi:hypothetical protein
LPHRDCIVVNVDVYSGAPVINSEEKHKPIAIPIKTNLMGKPLRSSRNDGSLVNNAESATMKAPNDAYSVNNFQVWLMRLAKVPSEKKSNIVCPNTDYDTTLAKQVAKFRCCKPTQYE